MKRTVSTLLLMAALITSTACTAEIESSDSSTSVTAVSTDSTGECHAVTVDLATVEAPSEPVSFRAGVWEYYENDIPCGVYIFYDDANGSTLSYDMGTGVGFLYEQGDGSVVFRYGDAEDYSPYIVNTLTENEALLTSEDGYHLMLKYIQEGDDISFYSDEELSRLASEYYNRSCGAVPPRISVTTQADGSVTLHLYESLPDHNATWAWYSVNRFTAQAEDVITGEIFSLIAE